MCRNSILSEKSVEGEGVVNLGVDLLKGKVLRRMCWMHAGMLDDKQQWCIVGCLGIIGG